MPGKVIGKIMNYGYPGSVSRSPDTIITVYPCKGGDIQFGDPVVLNSDNSVSPFSDASTADEFIGIAARVVKQANDSDGEAYYSEGDAVDVLIRGNIAVKVVDGTPAVRGKAYVRNGTGTGHRAGDFVTEATEGETVELPNVIFSTGKKDANGVAEASILTRLV